MKKVTFILMIAALFITNLMKAEDKTSNNVLLDLDNYMSTQEQLLKYSAPDFIETTDLSINEEELNSFMETTEELLKYNPNNFDNTIDVYSDDNFEAFITSLRYSAPSEDYSEIITESQSLADYIDYTIASLKYTAPAGRDINKVNFNYLLVCTMN